MYGTLYIDSYFDNLIHLEVCIGVRYDVCKPGNSRSPLYKGFRAIYIDKYLNVKVVKNRVCGGENVYANWCQLQCHL